MSDFYVLTTAGTVPVTVIEAKSHLRIPETLKVDDDLLTAFLASASDFAEKYTGRELRANSWTLFLDAFADRICLRRDPVDTITSVKYLDDTSPTPGEQTVPASVYYLKKGVQASEVLLQPDQEYLDGLTPATTLNEREQSVEIEFATVAHRCLAQAKLGILRHVAFMYENRGDCDPVDAADTAKRSGASILYNQIRISRV